MTSLYQLHQFATEVLSDHGIEDASLEAEVLLLDFFGYTRTAYILNLQTEVQSKDLRRIKGWLKKRARRIPLAYISRKAYFMDHLYDVRPGVLIPRPETEGLIEVFEEKCKTYSPDVIFDIGCGSGILAIEAALRYPGAKVYAWDISRKAIATTLQNKVRHQVPNLEVLNRDFFSDRKRWASILSKASVPIILTNPPYIPDEHIALLQDEVRLYEPKRALKGGSDGLIFYRALIKGFMGFGCVVICEIGIDQKPPLSQFLDYKGLSEYEFIADIHGIPRILVINFRHLMQ